MYGFPKGQPSFVLFTGLLEGVIRRWDLRNNLGRMPVQEYDANPYSVHCLATDPSQRTLVSGASRGVICFDFDTGQPGPTFLREHMMKSGWAALAVRHLHREVLLLITSTS